MKILKKLAQSIKEAVARGDIEIEVLVKKCCNELLLMRLNKKIYLNFYKKH